MGDADTENDVIARFERWGLVIVAGLLSVGLLFVVAAMAFQLGSDCM
jgi:hypothetical protein